MTPHRTILLLALMLYAGAAEAQTLQSHAPVKSGTCQLTCSTRQSDDEWKSETQCFEHLTERQCDDLADHHNKSDAYPNRMKCEAKISSPCTATQ